MDKPKIDNALVARLRAAPDDDDGAAFAEIAQPHIDRLSAELTSLGMALAAGCRVPHDGDATEAARRLVCRMILLPVAVALHGICGKSDDKEQTYKNLVAEAAAALSGVTLSNMRRFEERRRQGMN